MHFFIDSQRINTLLLSYLPELLQWRGVDFDDGAEIDESELKIKYDHFKKSIYSKKGKSDLKAYLLKQVEFSSDTDRLNDHVNYEELAFLFLCIAHAKYLNYQNNESAIRKDALINLLQLAIMAKAGRWESIEINLGQTKQSLRQKNVVYNQPATFRNIEHFASTKSVINLFANIYNISLTTPELIKANDNLTSLDELIQLKSSLFIKEEVMPKQIEANGALMIAKYLNDHTSLKFKTGKKYSSAQIKLIYHVYYKLGWQELEMDLGGGYVDRFSKEVNRNSTIIT